MADGVTLQTDLRANIDAEMVRRKAVHQARIARLRVGSGMLLAAAPAAAAPQMPLVMLAHGDSWFDYPLDGNGISLSDTDIIAQLRTMGDVNPVILNLSHYGDATTDELSRPKQQRMIEALTDPSNWLTGKPDAILFSGGGNDIAGEQFCIFLDYAGPGSTGLNDARFREALGMVEASYRDLFVFRDRYAPGVPIFGHGYDFPLPNGRHPICAGPWLQPSLQYTGWTTIAQGKDIAKRALVAFKDLLVRLEGEDQGKNNFHLINTQGTLSDADWANELHPHPAGFRNLAGNFVPALRTVFPGRI
jgi:hypothetical protein